MKRAVCVLAGIAVSGMSLALADPPPTPAAQAPAATTATQPQASVASTASTPAKSANGVTIQSTPEVDTLEKHFLAEGYKMKIVNGEKYFCRREEELGSRLGGHTVCATAEKLQSTEEAARNVLLQSELHQNNPSGK